MGAQGKELSQSLDFLRAIVERLTFHSETSGYTVARVLPVNCRELVTITGNFAYIQTGQTLELHGFWKEHPEYGMQFNVVRYLEIRPSSITGIEKYLGSGLIKGIGPVTAKRLVDHFGLETLDVIEKHVNRLREIKGVGLQRARTIDRAWREQKAIKEVMLFLQSNGVSTAYAAKIYKHYGDDAISVVATNPYKLAEDIFGIGFLTADKIARNVGIDVAALERYQSGVFHLLRKATEEGHCYLPREELLKLAERLLMTEAHVPQRKILDTVVDKMSNGGTLVVEECDGEQGCYTPSLFHTECTLAESIAYQVRSPREFDLSRVERWIEKYAERRNVTFSPEQYRALSMAAYEKVLILTGGPGCGKTFTVASIVALWKAMGKSIALAAPTGRAAQRLSEVTGIEAKTLHRLLEFDPSHLCFKRTSEHPLTVDAIIVDEASMVDVFLAHSLLKAVSATSQLVLVGDADQLPSVGPGTVLKDLLAADVLPVVRLTQVFRQSAKSAIITAAHEVRHGTFPHIEPLSRAPRSDCLWHDGGQGGEEGIAVISELVQTALPQWGFNPVRDVQVLSS